MSHADDGTLHAYLDGALTAAEARALEGHLRECAPCRRRLDEERALIARADELLGRAAPPERDVPPFRHGDPVPPGRLWWRLRGPLAWAATVVLALGIGLYLGQGAASSRDEQPAMKVRSDVAARAAPSAPAAAAPPQPTLPPTRPRLEPRGAPAPAAPAPVAQAERIERKPQAVKPPPAGVVPVTTPSVAGTYLPTGPMSRDSARALLGTEPFAVPGLPVRGMYGARMIGYTGVVVVEQALDSGTTIAVINGHPTPAALEAVVVTGAAAPAAESGRAAASPRLARQRGADSVVPLAPLAEGTVQAKPGVAVLVQGPLPPDSLAALRRRVQPLPR